MRLAGMEKLGFYPTQDPIVNYLKSRIQQPEHKTTALDPCAGTGSALAQIAPKENCITYGIEPDKTRFTDLKENIKQPLHASLEDCSIAHNSFSLLLLNPPYDIHYDNAKDYMDPVLFKARYGKTIRKEILFLRRTLPYLAPNGLLIYIVPEHILDKHCNEYLSARLDNIEAYRYPVENGLYDQFKQILIVGNKKPNKPQPTPALINLQPFTEALTTPLALPQTSACKLFRSHKLALDAAADLFNQQRDRLQANLYPKQNSDAQNTTAPLPLHLGHLSLMLAAGKINGLMKPGTPERHIIRGHVNKHRNATQTTEKTETGTLETTRIKDSYSISVKLLTPDGLITTLT